VTTKEVRSDQAYHVNRLAPRQPLIVSIAGESVSAGTETPAPSFLA
jgi:hypothetical protein